MIFIFQKKKNMVFVMISWNEHDERYQFSLVKEWFTEEDTNQRYDETYGKDYQKWIDNHFDEIEYHKQESRMIMVFYFLVGFITLISKLYIFIRITLMIVGG